VQKICSGERPPIPEHYSEGLNKIIDMCLQIDIEKRPSIKELLNMDIVREKMAQFVE